MTVAELRASLDGWPSDAIVLVRTCEGDEIDRTVEVTDVEQFADRDNPGDTAIVLTGDLDKLP